MKDLMRLQAPIMRQEDLAHIWNILDTTSSAQVAENLQDILQVTALKLVSETFEYLLSLVRQSFHEGADENKDQLLIFLHKIGEETASSNVQKSHAVLDLIWELARHPSLCIDLIDKAITFYIQILGSIPHRKSLIESYISKCIGEIRENAVFVALRQLNILLQALLDNSFNKTECVSLNICR